MYIYIYIYRSDDWIHIQFNQCFNVYDCSLVLSSFVGKFIGTHLVYSNSLWWSTLRFENNGCHVADDSFKYIFSKENVGICFSMSNWPEVNFVQVVSVCTKLNRQQAITWTDDGSVYRHKYVSAGAWITKKFPCQNSCYLTRIFSPGFWLTRSTAASQSEAMLENTWTLTWIFFCYPGPRHQCNSQFSVFLQCV